jgi:hypothetical protein
VNRAAAVVEVSAGSAGGSVPTLRGSAVGTEAPTRLRTPQKAKSRQAAGESFAQKRVMDMAGL